MQVVVLCGGLGTRLGALTKDRPKYLVSVAGRPFCDWQIDLLWSQGFDEFAFCIGHLGSQIQAHIEYRWHDLGAEFFTETEHLGPWVAYERVRSDLNECHAVIYGDSYLPVSRMQIAAWWAQAPVRPMWHPDEYGIRFCAPGEMRDVRAPEKFYEVGSAAGIERLEEFLCGSGRWQPPTTKPTSSATSSSISGMKASTGSR